MDNQIQNSEKPLLLVQHSERPENKQLINAWTEIGLIGLGNIATEGLLASKAGKAVTSWIKRLFGGNDATQKGLTANPFKSKSFNGINAYSPL